MTLALALFLQTPKTLDLFLKEAKIPRALAVSAERTRAAKGTALAAYRRKEVRLGTVVAIVPIDNLQFDDGLRQSPNLYDGLPRDAKVLYLMSTLSAPQWREASGPGLGINSLSEDQRNVFRSILPNKVGWTRFQVGKDGRADKAIDKGVLDEKAVGGVRLRIERQLQLHTYLLDRENAYTFHQPNEEAGRPGDVAYERDDSEELDKKDAFGVAIRRTVPNVPKRGGLDTAALSAVVALPAKTTVRAALAQIGAASGREILADLRVADRSVLFEGGKARAGDLLDALALAVGGTYRRVGTAYELTFDVMGLGARKLRFALWKEGIQADVNQRMDAWRKAVAAGGGVANVDYEANGPLNPGPALRKRLERNPIGKVSEEPYSTDELTPELRAFLDRVNARTTTQKIRTDAITADSRLVYRFVLPNGSALPQEGYLGEVYQFGPGPFSIPENPIPPSPKIRLAAGAKASLALRAETVAEAAQAVGVAQAFGFGELWIETSRPEALAAATAGPLPVRLVVRPWSLPTGDDRTILGETGAAVAKRVATDPLWARLFSGSRRQTYPPSTLQAVDGNLLSPFDPRWPARRAALIALAKTPRLAGIVVMESMPHGYEAGDDFGQVGGYNRNLVESWAFGYDEPTRLAFLRAKGIDPIDVSNRSVYFDVDLRPEYFADDALRGSPSVYDGSDDTHAAMDGIGAAWSAFRGAANAREVKALLSGFPDLPIRVDFRIQNLTQPLQRGTVLLPWTRGEALPAYTEQFPPDRPDGLYLLPAPDPRAAQAMEDYGNTLKQIARRPESPIAIGLARIPAPRWTEFLGRWFERRG